jgi:ABC-type anion transport system duplicated permease subunit
LDGEQVMAMFHRSPKSSPPLRRRQEEIARQEAELHERLEKLERLVAKMPLIEKNRAEQGPKDNRTDKRFRVSVASQDQRESRRSRRPRSMRKERRDGQIIFLLLLVALAAAVIWLISNLHS